MGKIRNATLAVIALGNLFAALPAHADPQSDWLKSRQSEYATWQAQHPREEIWDAPDVPKLVVIPAGSFLMGSPEAEPDRRADEGPQHRVTFGYRLAVSKFNITRSEYGAFVAATNRPDPPSCYFRQGNDWKDSPGYSWQRPGFEQTASDPAVCINYDDAVAYAAWLSHTTGHHYRLLSEADNPFGLHDMPGNVWSWTADCYSNSYAGAPLDGSARTGANCAYRVLRGSSWYSGPPTLRSAFRNWNIGGERRSTYGFRLARDLPQ